MIQSDRKKKITIMFKWFSFEWKLKKGEKHKKKTRRREWEGLPREEKKCEKNIIESKNNFPTLMPDKALFSFYWLCSSFPFPLLSFLWIIISIRKLLIHRGINNHLISFSKVFLSSFLRMNDNIECCGILIQNKEENFQPW